MKKPEEFNDWIKQQIEDNPQLPPEAAWQQISETVELEDAWQGISQDLELDNLWSTIDTRLHIHQQLKIWELSGVSITAAFALLLLFIPLYLQLSPEESSMAQETATTEQQQGVSFSTQIRSAEHTKIRKSIKGRNGRQGVETSTAGTSPMHATSGYSKSQNLGKTNTRGRRIQDSQHNHGVAIVIPKDAPPATTQSRSVINNAEIQAKTNPLFNGLSAEALRAEGLTAHLDLEKGTLTLPMVEKASVVVDKKEKINKGESFRIGLGATGRISWLMNEKTFQGMEKSSLTTPIPSYRKSFSLQVEKSFSPKVSLLADLMLYSETGQRYREYQSGVYGETNTALRYSHLNILAAYSPSALGYSTKSHTRLLAGLAGGWLHSASFKGPLGNTDIRDEYRKGSAGLVLGYEYTLPLMQNLWMGYGLRGHLDLFNIASKTEEISSAFNQTRNAFLDFTISLKYDLKNK